MGYNYSYNYWYKRIAHYIYTTYLFIQMGYPFFGSIQKTPYLLI